MTTLEVTTRDTIEQQIEHKNDSKILLVSEEKILVSQLTEYLTDKNFDVLTCENQQELYSVLGTFIPALVFMDSSMLDERVSMLLRNIQEDSQEQIPFIFFSDSYEIKTHLNCVRAGGLSLYSKPIIVDQLIEHIDLLINHDNVEKYRVLIVDDDKSMSIYFSKILSNAGIEVRYLTNPLQVVSSLNEFKPDLILMDIYMPDCNGTELATLIRQLDSFSAIPIVYLSGETDTEKQLYSLQKGADEFLSKAIKPWHLVAAVKSRIKRSRTIHSIMYYDRLTGLLNRCAFDHYYHYEFSRTERSDEYLSIVMLDIDDFKLVNDTYGHAVGDKVLKVFATFLKRRLRKTDIIGRYGGEEFIIAMPNTNSKSAKNVIDVILKAFASYTHEANGHQFHVTVSCGIETFINSNDLNQDQLINNSDKALYDAKKYGKNQVVIFK